MAPAAFKRPLPGDNTGSIVPAPRHIVEQKTTGIILRTRPLTETSLIVQWLSPEHGRIDTAAKGARRNKSPFRGKLDLFFEADFTFVPSRRSELHTLREAAILDTHPALRTDLARLQLASYAVTLIEQTTEKQTPMPEFHELLRSLLKYLAAQPAEPKLALSFELKLLSHLGQQPDSAQGALTPGSREIVQQLTARDWPALASLLLSAAQVQELGRFLHGFMQFHLGRIPKGRSSVLDPEL